MEEINHLPEKDDWKKLEKNNLTFDLNVLYVNNKKIYHAYVLRHNSNREKQVNLLIIPNEEWWHHITVKKILALLRRITSKRHDDFYCLNCLHSFRTKHKIELHKKLCENKYFYNIFMTSEDTKMLEFNQY